MALTHSADEPRKFSPLSSQQKAAASASSVRIPVNLRTDNLARFYYYSWKARYEFCKSCKDKVKYYGINAYTVQISGVCVEYYHYVMKSRVFSSS